MKEKKKEEENTLVLLKQAPCDLSVRPRLRGSLCEANCADKALSPARIINTWKA